MQKLFLIILLLIFFVPAVARAQVTYQKDIRPLNPKSATKIAIAFLVVILEGE